MDRQKVTGWILVVVAGAYLLNFLKVRLLAEGLPIEKKEWVQFAGMIVLLMIGTINVRMAAMREQRRKSGQLR
jgi:Na+/melibiose symporter-like transporter